MGKVVLDNAFIAKDQIQRPDGNTEHDGHVSQRAYLHIHLIGDNRHGDKQTVADEAAQRTESQMPVAGGVVFNTKWAQLRNAWTEDKPQNGFKEFNQCKSI